MTTNSKITHPCETEVTENKTAKALAQDLGIDNPEMVSDQGPAPVVGSTGVVLSVNVSEMKGTRLQSGNALVEVSQIGKARHTRCAIYHLPYHTHTPL